MGSIVVTGIGIISAIGNNLQENLAALIAEKSGIKPSVFLDSKFKETHLFGEINKTNEQLKQDLNYKGEELSRTSLLACTAFEEAVSSASMSKEILRSTRTAFISASTVGGMSNSSQLYADANKKSNTKAYLETYNFSAHSLAIAKQYNLKGTVNTINTACTSSLNSIIFGANLLKSGLADRVIVGGADSLSKFTVNGFNSMGILTEGYCKPFSEDRMGLNLGEGAAYLVLENNTGQKNYGFISGYANACDAYHASSISDEATGVVESIKEALQAAQLNASQIDYINAHGTATENNDNAEQIAYNKVFKENFSFSSTKGFTGHTLGACGAIESVFSLLSLKNNLALANVHYSKKMEAFESIPVLHNTKKDIQHVLTNSYGFNGNCSSLIFSKS